MAQGRGGGGVIIVIFCHDESRRRDLFPVTTPGAARLCVFLDSPASVVFSGRSQSALTEVELRSCNVCCHFRPPCLVRLLSLLFACLQTLPSCKAFACV